MHNKAAITLIGAGNLALALGPALRQAGYSIDELVVRDVRRGRALARKLGASATTIDKARFAAGVIWLLVPDASIRPVAEALASRGEWRGKMVLHSSGLLASDELSALLRRGASVASLHPMMTFVRSSPPSLAGIGFSAEGDRAAVRLARAIVRDLGGNLVAVRKSAKPLYHAWAAFNCPLIIMDLALAERIARVVGLTPAQARRAIEPIVRRTIDNYFAHGAAAAFSGPLLRGDVATVRRHLRELARVPGARQVYVALLRSALDTLPVARKAEIRKLVAG